MRKKILDRDNNECQICKRNGRHTKAVIVHHIKHLDDHWELRLDPDNLESVCFQCHENEHTHERKRFKDKDRSEEYSNEERW